MNGGYILLHRKILDWEWFQYPNTFSLFIYLLLKANYRDTLYRGRLIRRGQLVTSLPKLATGTGLTIRQTRTALSRLISTGEVTDESSNQDRVITVVKYDDYQNATDETTGKRQANDRRSGRQTTDESTASKEYKEYKKDKKDISSSKIFVPPTVMEVEAYCDERGVYLIDSQAFVDYYASRGWVIGKNGQQMKDWRAAVRLWERKERERLSADDSDMPY